MTGRLPDHPTDPGDEATCKRCGTCCHQGGPALHSADLELIRSGRLSVDDLITVRRGELAFQPLGKHPEPVGHEFLKLRGVGGSWCCLFYDEAGHGCSHYPDRPLACRLLDCHNTRALLDLVGRDLLTRFDCLDADDPLLPLAHQHEAESPCPDLETVRLQLLQPKVDRTALLGPLEASVNRDLSYRTQTAATFQLSLERELFLFGRPLFQLLLPLGIHAVQAGAGLHLVAAAKRPTAC